MKPWVPEIVEIEDRVRECWAMRHTSPLHREALRANLNQLHRAHVRAYKTYGQAYWLWWTRKRWLKRRA